MSAASKGHLSVVKRLLLEAGVDLNIRDTDLGRMHTALHLAATGGHEEILSALLLGGADKDALDKDWETPLMWAAMEGHLSIVDMLFQVGVNVNIHSTRRLYHMYYIFSCVWNAAPIHAF